MADAIGRRAGLGDTLAEAIESGGRDTNYLVELSVKDGPSVSFIGAEVSSYSMNPDRSRWAELKLWETIECNYVAGRAWHSNIGGEATFWTAAQVQTVEDAMDLWGWDAVAKAFARKLKWDVVRRIP